MSNSLFSVAPLLRICQKGGCERLIYSFDDESGWQFQRPNRVSKFSNMRKTLITALASFWLLIGSTVIGAEPSDNERRGLFERIFTKNKQSQFSPPGVYNETVQDAFMDRETDTVSARVEEGDADVEGRVNDPVERYPAIPGYLSIKNSSQKNIEILIERIYEAYEGRIGRMDPPDLRSSRMLALGSIPTGFPSVWKTRVDAVVWGDQRTVAQSLEDTYRRTLEYSNQIKVFSDLPLIRETGMQEADGEFDTKTFMEGRRIRSSEPIGSTLTTGNSATRYLRNEDYFEGGLRKKFFTGAEATLSNRISTLDDNSSFLTPQNQGASEMVLSVVQPLLQGGGYHYNQSKIKLAKFDASSASAEFVRQLQGHLVEVNRAYWALFYARSYYLLSRDLVDRTGGVVGQLEQRSDLDALQSELLRARAALATRESVLNRAEMAIRNSEERLRILVNDPDHDIGSNTEIVPATPPIMTRFVEDVRTVAKQALRNRPEIQQGFDELRASIVRRDARKNEKWPTLNLVAEMMLGDIEPNFATGRAFQDQFGDGTGYVLGFSFEQPWDNDVDRARLLRSEIELRQKSNQLRATIDLVLLEALVTYRELITAYRDMQGRYSALVASREELRQLQERLEVDTEQDDGRTTASQLQLILDSMDRNQSAEEYFLDSVVAYNASFAALERAKGTLLRSEKVEIERVLDTDPTHPDEDLERLDVFKPTYVQDKSGKTYRYEGYPSQGAERTEVVIPDVPPLAVNELPKKSEEKSRPFGKLRKSNSKAAAEKRKESITRSADEGLFARSGKPDNIGSPSVAVAPLKQSPASSSVSSALRPSPAPVELPGSTAPESYPEPVFVSSFPEGGAVSVVQEKPAASVRKIKSRPVEVVETVNLVPAASARPVGNQ